MKHEPYNGWYNYETWLFNLYHDGMWYDTAQEIIQDGISPSEAIYQLAEIIATDEIVSSLNERTTTAFLADIVDAFLGEVNFTEIARHYIAEIVDEEGS